MLIEKRANQYGVVFDHWQLCEFLGSGSGGKTAVYRLVHRENPRMQSALKIVSLIEREGKIRTLYFQTPVTLDAIVIRPTLSGSYTWTSEFTLTDVMCAES